MSTIKSQTEHLTLNADGSGKEIKFQCNGTEVAKIDANGWVDAGVSTLAALTDTTVSGVDPAINSVTTGNEGHLWVNKASGETYICTDADTGANTWKNIGAGDGNIAPVFTATGGSVTTYTSGGVNYKVHTFLTSNNFVVTGGGTAELLLVAGGGGVSAAEGYSGSTGGGGAGGMVEVASKTVSVGTHAIVVGIGGALSNNTAVPASSGGDSTGLGFTAKGGGGGVDYGTTPAASGGSGAGGSESSGVAGSSTQSSNCATGAVCYGNAGSNAAGYTSGSGGGGGASAAGSGVGTNSGGAGRANSIRTGSAVTYSLGGMGGNGNSWNHGNDGGGNTGNGATGAGSSSGNIGSGASGGSGIVVVRYIV